MSTVLRSMYLPIYVTMSMHWAWGDYVKRQHPKSMVPMKLFITSNCMITKIVEPHNLMTAPAMNPLKKVKARRCQVISTEDEAKILSQQPWSPIYKDVPGHTPAHFSPIAHINLPDFPHAEITQSHQVQQVGSKQALILVAVTSPKPHMEDILKYNVVRNDGVVRSSFLGATKASRGRNLASGDNRLFFPIVDYGHWFEFVVDFEFDLFSFLDSFHKMDSSFHHRIEDSLIENFIHLWELIISPDHNFGKFKAMYPNLPKQQTLVDCGVFAMKFMEIWKPYLNICRFFSHQDILNIRLQYANKLYFLSENEVDLRLVLDFYANVDMVLSLLLVSGNNTVCSIVVSVEAFLRLPMIFFLGTTKMLIYSPETTFFDL